MLRAEKEDLKLIPENSYVYDNRCPPLVAMLSSWLAEEVTVVEEAIKVKKENAAMILQKLSLNLSVAHLAYLINCFLRKI